MSLVHAWVGLPVALGLLCLGCALAVERAAGIRVAGALMLPIGLATIIVVAQALTVADLTAELATPVVVVLAAAGLVLGRRELRRAVGPWLLAAGLAYLAYGAPVLATGTNTFTGFIKLDDTASWLAIIDHIMVHGRDLDGLAPSTYETTLAGYLPGGYPLGGFLGLGVAKQILGIDPMWLYVPFCAYVAAMLALALFALTGGLVASTRWRIAAAAVAAQSAALYGFTMWGGIKEIVFAALLPLVAALAGMQRTTGSGGRVLLPLAIACAAALATLSLGAAVWLAPLVLPMLLVSRDESSATWPTALRLPALRLPALRLPELRLPELRLPELRISHGARLLGVVAACSVPAILLAGTFLKPLFTSVSGGAAGGVFTSQRDVGNLGHPLHVSQLVGIWPAGDFRIDPTHEALTYLGIMVALVLAVLGVVLAWRRGYRGLPAYVVGVVGICLLIRTKGSPWVEAKSLAQASPAIVLGAIAGAAMIRGRRELRVVALLGAGIVVGGVLWSNALAYREVTLAPAGQLRELERIAELAAGEGPTLMTEFSPIGARHILRDADAESASEIRRRDILLRGGLKLPMGARADIDVFDPASLRSYRSLVLRRAPDASRPPSEYRLRWAGTYYELWQRPAGARPVIEHLPLGKRGEAGSQPRCADVRRLARAAGPRGYLATVVRRPTASLSLGTSPLPAGWTPAADTRRVTYTGPGTIERTLRVRLAGPLQASLGGSTRGRVTLSVDGRKVASARHQLNWAGGVIPLGTVRLAPGLHRVSLRYDDGGLTPGNLGQQINPFVFGPLVFSRDSNHRPITAVPSAQADRLCGQQLDWIEVLPAA